MGPQGGSGLSSCANPAVPTIPTEYEMADDGDRVVVQRLCEEYRAEAVETMVEVMRNATGMRDRVTAAKTILEYADGKPTQVVQQVGGTGLVVNILKLSTGKVERVPAVDVPGEVVPEVDAESVDEFLARALSMGVKE